MCYIEAATCATPIRGHSGRGGYGRFAPIHLNTARASQYSQGIPQYPIRPNTATTNKQTAISSDLGPLKIVLPARHKCTATCAQHFKHIHHQSLHFVNFNHRQTTDPKPSQKAKSRVLLNITSHNRRQQLKSGYQQFR